MACSLTIDYPLPHNHCHLCRLEQSILSLLNIILISIGMVYLFVRKTNSNGAQPGSSASLTAAQNVWDRRLRNTNSGGRKPPLRPINREEIQIMDSSKPEHGLMTPSTPGTELRRRVSPNDATDPPTRPVNYPQSSSTPKPPLP